MIILSLSSGRALGQQPAAEKIGPFYDPVSKSYFELRDYSSVKPPGRKWAVLSGLVKRLSYKGVRVRLAVIRSPETHNFVLREILNKTDKYVGTVFIGARLFCNGMKLMWVDGHVRRRGDFRAWNPTWYRNKDITCVNSPTMEFMPVTYRRSGASWRWQASGQIRNFPHVLVEYPTGKE